MSTKPFELSVLLALLNGYELLNVTPEQQHEVVSHVHGKPVEDHQIQEMFDSAVSYIREKYPKLAEAADLVANLPPDQNRYNKMIDLFKKWFHIEPMQLAA